MSRILRRRPSPAMVVAFVALCVALAGTATALPGRARVKKDDIARAAVRSQSTSSRTRSQSKHISRAQRDALEDRAGARSTPIVVGQDALTGENIVESSLARSRRVEARTPSKVNGRSVEKIAFVAAAGTAATTVLNLNGLVDHAACSAGPGAERHGRARRSAAR